MKYESDLAVAALDRASPHIYLVGYKRHAAVGAKLGGIRLVANIGVIGGKGETGGIDMADDLMMPVRTLHGYIAASILVLSGHWLPAGMPLATNRDPPRTAKVHRGSPHNYHLLGYFLPGSKAYHNLRPEQENY